MKKWNCLGTQAMVCLALVSLLFAGHVYGDSRPNILVILADDLGYADLGFTGSKEIQTPVLDKLAANGVTFAVWVGYGPLSGSFRYGDQSDQFSF